jgi:hypothetical protein
MSRESSLTQSGHSVRQALTAYLGVFRGGRLLNHGDDARRIAANFAKLP